MVKSPNVLRILELSDIHLGHSKTPTDNTLGSLYSLLNQHPELPLVDMVILAGDVFDQLLLFPDDHINCIQVWMLDLLKVCSINGIMLRVLEGTPSHDRKQSKHFIHLQQSHQIVVDLKYVDTLSVEHIEHLDLQVLYIPDECYSNHNKIQKAVSLLLEDLGLDRVDITIMHGMFEHQVPKGLKLPVHDIDFYSKITKLVVFAGHIHQMSHVQNVLVAGSFNRLAHNEEDDKGFWDVTLDLVGDNNKYRFIINAKAAIYKTISLIGLTPEETDSILLGFTELPNRSRVRLVMSKDADHVIKGNAAMAFNNTLIWSPVKWISAASESLGDSLVPTLYVPEIINNNTISNLLDNRLAAYGAEPVVRKLAIELLEEVRNE